MKNILLSLFCLILFVDTISAQSDCCATDTTNQGSSWYVATGISIPNTADEDFTVSAYPSAELGVVNGDLTVAAVLGRNNLSNSQNVEGLDNFWYELKTAYSIPIVEGFDGYGVIGLGRYFDGSSTFLEYGVGVSKSFEDLGVFLQVSNWDGVTFVTPGVSWSF